MAEIIATVSVGLQAPGKQSVRQTAGRIRGKHANQAGGFVIKEFYEMKSKKEKSFLVRLTKDDHERLRKKSEEYRVSRSELIRRIIRNLS